MEDKKIRGTMILLPDINEHFDWNRILLNIPDAGDVSFDLGQVNHVNSMGIRHYSQLDQVEKLSGRTILLYNAKMEMLEQFSMFPALSRGSKLKSFIVEYFCDSGHSSQMHYDCDAFINLSQVSNLESQWRCPTCSKPGMMECTFDSETFWKHVWALKNGTIRKPQITG